MGSNYSLRFDYDEKGYGQLDLLRPDGSVEIRYYSRSGSIDKAGKLVNVIKPGTWYIRDGHPPVDTNELGMTITPGQGWKVRLYWLVGDGQYRYDGFLIHPDGNLPGSLGCIVTIKSDALDLKKRIAEILRTQQVIEVKVLSPESRKAA